MLTSQVPDRLDCRHVQARPAGPQGGAEAPATRRLRRTVCALAILVVAGASPRTAWVRDVGPLPVSGPRFSATGPDAAEYGSANGYPIGDRWSFSHVGFLVGALSHLDQIFEGRLIRRAASPSQFSRAASEPPIRYEYQGQSYTLDDYLERHPVTGLLIAKNQTILVERYQYARNDQHRFTSWSMAKTVTAMLVGIAIAEGRIRTIDDRADAYVPALAGTEYGGTSLRHLLQMSSGVRFHEQYTPDADLTQLTRDTFRQLGPGGVDAVRKYNERVAPSGTRFSYASVETQVLGLVLTSAIGRTVADYLEEKIWRPIGAEADARWLVDSAGQEATFCCLNAVLRDYARLGLLLAHDGNWLGRQVIPAAWVEEATSRDANRGHLWPGVATRFWGYGYQTWIYPVEQRRFFALLGDHAQSIHVDPRSRLVMIHTAVRRRQADDPANRETTVLWRAVVKTLGR